MNQMFATLILFVLFCVRELQAESTRQFQTYHDSTGPTFKLTNTPCQQTNNILDVIINCTRVSLDRVNSSWFPLNTTVIYLDYNLLTEIKNETFKNLTQLRFLSIRYNKIYKIHTNAFSGLTNLEVLNLEYNALEFDNNSYPDGIFSVLINLKELYLRQDTNYIKSEYPSCFLCPLTNLTTLSIDSIGETVNLGPEFKKLGKLTHFVLNVCSNSISESAFKNLNHLTDLTIDGSDTFSNFSNTALAYLPLLDSFTLMSTNLRKKEALHSLKPLVGRNMTSIRFLRVILGSHSKYSSYTLQECVLDLDKTKYLIQICVRSFEFSYSNLIILDQNALISTTWSSCLEYLNLSHNMWIGNNIAFIRLFTLRRLENIYVDRNFYGPTTPRKFEISDYYLSENKHLHQLKSKETENIICYETDVKRKNKTKFKGLIFYGSKSLKYLNVRKSIDSARLNINISFVGMENLEYLDFTDNGFKAASGKFEGLTKLKTILASGNQLSDFSPTFLDSVPNVENLALANSKFDLNSFQSNSSRIFLNLKSLKRLDLSLNSLSFLAPNTFSTNPNLTELYLVTNRFTEIPFNLKLTPNLRVLDLRENAISTFEEDITFGLDELAQKNGKFILRLAGNDLLCACVNFFFVKWILTTNVEIDFDSNLLCVNESGLYSHLDKHLNIGTFWRQCMGQQYLYFSVVILCVIAIIFLLSFVVMRCKLYIVAYVAQILGTVPRRRLTDFQNHVFIVSSPNENFVTVLGNYLKQTFFLNTRDSRDLEPGRPEYEDLFAEINVTWRVILVVTVEFFHDNNFQLLYTLVLNSMSHDNPGKVLLLYERNVQLNVDLINAIGEDNILEVPLWQMTPNMDEFLYDRIFIDC
ncbi:toll-like receptor 13 [Physella acuta]|uniref:toll-like receptor 13 n=1 Tax=Physella acuta TaxID=109671 RepID=UPI0027DB664F|nr:toll-like receptor 13 [Physella acuta]